MIGSEDRRRSGTTTFLTGYEPLSREDKLREGVLCGYSLNSKAYQIYVATSPSSSPQHRHWLIPLVDAVSTYENSSPTENTEDICITYSEEIERFLKKVSKLTSRNMDRSTSAGEEEPAAEGAGDDETLETTRTGAWPTDR